eukprot:SAG31_NODE_34_length_31842_cov_31.677850_29_plen_43_part_00
MLVISNSFLRFYFAAAIGENRYVMMTVRAPTILQVRVLVAEG